MTNSNRFNSAIQKLYNAFNANTLHPECVKSCAVGTICNGTEQWKHLAVGHGSTELSYVGLVNENFGKRLFGYKPSELLKIEQRFLKACGYKVPLNKYNNERLVVTNDMLFTGLCAVVEELCVLDNIANVLEIKQLFAQELVALNAEEISL